MSLRAGRLSHRVRLEQYAEALDSNGLVIQDLNTGAVSRVWTLVAEVWAAIEPLSAREFIESQATQSQITGKVITRYRSDMTAGMRFVSRGRYYNIAGILPDKDSGLEFVTIPVTEGVNDGE